MSNDDLRYTTERLSILLNRQVTKALAKTVRSHALSKSLEEFTKILSVIGLKDEGQAAELFNHVKSQKATTREHPLPKRSVPALPKKRAKGVSLAYDDLDEEEDEEEKKEEEEEEKEEEEKEEEEKEEDVVVDSEGVRNSHEPESTKQRQNTERPKFKKMKREDAARLKQIQPDDSKTLEDEKIRSVHVTSTTSSNKREYTNNVIKKRRDNVDDDDNNDDVGPKKITTTRSFKKESKQPTKADTDADADADSTAKAGGYFDANGRYVDHDHTSYNDFNRIPIESHVFIPPFLEKSKEYLTLQISGTSVKGAGPTINPVKDPNSELASMAKQGSLAVQTKKSKQERANQARDNVGSNAELKEEEKEEEEEEISNDAVVEDDEETVDNQKATIIKEQRQSLPAYAAKDDVVDFIRDNQVTIIIGETGSGKTTQLAQYLLDAGLAHIAKSSGSVEKKMIGCTQPRRVAAMSVAKRVCEERQVKLGEEVGYSVRFDDKTSSTKTLIKYMTEGILLREILADPLLNDYSCIIMDEAHERSLNTDILLGLFKGLLCKRRDLKLVVTSATMNADRFTKFFGAAPQFKIPGRTFPVQIYFNKNVSMDYVETSVKQILSIHLGNSMGNEGCFVNDGDILVFMTGQEDIEITCDLLREKLDMLENPPPLDILPIYSTMPQHLQKKIFRKKSATRRKVVIATNIAETSLTVDGVKYVIDCGLVKVKVYNPKLGMDTLQVVPISVANADQRSGRAGRTCAGTAYRLYTENATSAKSMYSQPIPEIQRTNLSNTMLLLKSLKVDDINTFPFLDTPPKDLLNCSLYDLWAMDALDNFGELTQLGRDMIKFPLEPTLSKLILLSTQHHFHCSEDIVTIVAMLSVANIFQRSKERANEADKSREKFTVADSDHLTLLNVYTQWELNLKKIGNNWSKMNQWCEKNFLQLKSLHRAREIKRQLVLIMQKNKLPLVKSFSDNSVRECLCAAFFQQSAKLVKTNLNGNPEFANLRHSYMKMYLHPTSTLLDSNMRSNFVIYHELILTSKEYMNYVTCVEPIWLLRYGYKFFGVAASAMESKFKDMADLELQNRFKQQLEKDKIEYDEEQSRKASRRIGPRPSSEHKKGILFKKRF
ncbi:uncharacterized protein LODBEIA_P09800 [Lodderomyces beijingensis]|uniref:RNA helicase n=1 Tax=Lodderomyces beijingensis TaxID=1775926 RepID=A0ABP0ZI20_9ASCO